MPDRCTDPTCQEHWPARESRIEGVVARLRENHKDCPPGVAEFQCNLRRIDEHEISLIIDEWEGAR
jgi:hypothetical protein